MQPGIEPEPRAFAETVGDPVAGLRLRPGHGGEMGGIDLGADLNGVAAVDEDAGFPGKDYGKARRSGEAREPGEPVVAGGHVFALVGVGTRDHEGIEADLRHLLAESREAGGAVLRRRGRLEVLEAHEARFMPITRARARGSLSKSAASCSVIAPASCSTSVIVTARS